MKRGEMRAASLFPLLVKVPQDEVKRHWPVFKGFANSRFFSHTSHELCSSIKSNFSNLLLPVIYTGSEE